MKQIQISDELNTGEMIKKIRAEKNITMQDLSEASGVSISAICRYEKGARVPNMGTFDRLMKAMDADVTIVTK